ncbi:MAG: hypothetical protein EHM21_02950, partial [Chloroflexi bacterium]
LAGCPPDRFGMLVSANCTTEDLYIAQKFTREVMHSTNIAVPAHALYGNGLPEVFDILRQSHPLDIINQASTTLCLGLDVHYAQSVVEVRLHQAKARGARIISISPNPQSLNIFVEECLQPIPGKETELIQRLCDLIGNDPSNTCAAPTQLRHAADLLREASSLVILTGPAFLAHPDNHALLPAVDRLARQTSARLIALPEQSNLAGSLLLGVSSPFNPAGQEVDALYLAGEDIPPSLPGRPFLIYQNIYPPIGALTEEPSGARRADLLLPAAAFTEGGGTLVDYSGCIQALNPAVQPPGEALPTWEILSRIARHLGAPGFDYPTLAALQAEIAAIPAFQPQSRVDSSSAPQPLPSSRSPYPPSGDHTYLGFPLSRYVAGLRPLHPPG